MTNHVPEATKPASGDYARLGAEAGSVADLMYMLNTEDWYDAINSRFVSELLDDTLPESILKAYLIRDFKFYNNGMMARLIKLAPRQETKDMLAAQSQWFADNEATYFEHFLEAYHVSREEYDATEPTPANKEYGAYLDSLSDKSWPELITAICCMEWLYLAWAKRTVDADVIQQVPAHKGWVDLHEGAHFRKWVGDLISRSTNTAPSMVRKPKCSAPSCIWSAASSTTPTRRSEPAIHDRISHEPGAYDRCRTRPAHLLRFRPEPGFLVRDCRAGAARLQ